MDDCLFCKVAKGEIPCAKVYEDEKTFAFLDINPVNKGHTLVITKEHYELITDVPEDLLADLIKTVKKVSKALLGMSDGVCIAQNNKEIAGQIVPHIHFHLIPRLKGDGHKFNWPSTKYEEGEAEKVAEKIKNLL
jgi:histidine triad (HIT) family protein